MLYFSLVAPAICYLLFLHVVLYVFLANEVNITAYKMTLVSVDDSIYRWIHSSSQLAWFEGRQLDGNDLHLSD